MEESHTWFVKPSECIVIHPGSKNLRIGLASDQTPLVLPHCIARRRRTDVTTGEGYLPKIKLNNIDVNKMIDEKAEELGNLLSTCLTSRGVQRFAAPSSEPFVVLEPVKVSLEGYHIPGKTDEKVLGQDALKLPPDSEFDLSWPIRRGRLNLHRGPGGSLSGVLHNIRDIWNWAIRDRLHVNPEGMHGVLVIGDVYVGEHVKRLVDLLFNEFKLKKLFVNLETVCAVFGAGTPSACVVDVGDGKTLVTCVDDGISLKQCRLLMEYGGSDITHLSHYLMKKTGFPYEECDPQGTYDGQLLEKIKETFCHLNLDHCGPVMGTFMSGKPGDACVEYSLNLNEEAMIPVLGMFSPEMLTLTGWPKSSHLHAPQAADPQDPHDDFYILQTQRRRGDVEFDELDCDEDGIPLDLKDPVRQETIPISQIFGVDQAILQCVERCESEDVKRKMLGTIVLVGGGLASIPGVSTWISNRLSVQMPKIFRGEPIEIITRPKDLPADMCVWRGAALMTHLDTCQELWISSQEWHKFGSKVLRERAVFGW